jgi:hypothetical protein
MIFAYMSYNLNIFSFNEMYIPTCLFETLDLVEDNKKVYWYGWGM